VNRYEPKLDPEHVNTPPGSPLTDFAILVSGFLLIALLLFISAGFLGDLFFSRLSASQEERLFHFTKSTGGLGQESPNAQVLMDKLAGSGAWKPRVRISCEKELNAYAVPGGTVLLTAGLMEKLKTETGLAFILAHELGHIAHRDHLRGLGRGLAIAIVGGLLGFGGPEQTALPLISGSTSRLFSREQERAADDFAITKVSETFGHLVGADEFFRLVVKENKLSHALSGWDSTHPNTEERLQKLMARRELFSERHKAPVPEVPFAQWPTVKECMRN
jgi:beta-barrel assembly-enhancing protease